MHFYVVVYICESNGKILSLYNFFYIVCWMVGLGVTKFILFKFPCVDVFFVFIFFFLIFFSRAAGEFNSCEFSFQAISCSVNQNISTMHMVYVSVCTKFSSLAVWFIYVSCIAIAVWNKCLRPKLVSFVSNVIIIVPFNSNVSYL